jgi:hypothetical protein
MTTTITTMTMIMITTTTITMVGQNVRTRAHHNDNLLVHAGHSHGKEQTVAFYVLCGILAFLIVEKIARAINGDGHGHSHGPSAPAGTCSACHVPYFCSHSLSRSPEPAPEKKTKQEKAVVKSSKDASQHGHSHEGILQHVCSRCGFAHF